MVILCNSTVWNVVCNNSTGISLLPTISTIVCSIGGLCVEVTCTSIFQNLGQDQLSSSTNSNNNDDDDDDDDNSNNNNNDNNLFKLSKPLVWVFMIIHTELYK